MFSSEFVKIIRQEMPSRVELESFGLEPHEIAAVQASFLAVARMPEVQIASNISELEKLISAYDCSGVEVGLIRFLAESRPHSHGVQVAYCEADSIVVEATGEVAMYDHADGRRSLSCAQESMRFLDALRVFVEMRNNKPKWNGRAEEAANLCAEMAGGGAICVVLQVAVRPLLIFHVNLSY